MAGIDHTIIAFHNGKLMRNEVKVEVDQYTSLIPFQYTRDGELYGVDFDIIGSVIACVSSDTGI